jgi:PPM family protein phosphatase
MQGLRSVGVAMIDLGEIRAHGAAERGDGVPALFRIEAAGRLVVVADAVGARARETRAAERAAETLVARMLPLPGDEALLARLADALGRANDEALEEPARGVTAMAGAVSLAALVVTSAQVIGVNIGNTRTYLTRAGALSRLNRDHAAVSELRGPLTAADAFAIHHMHLVTRALGVSLSIEPDVVHRSVRGGDRFLLCTAGAWACLGEQRLNETLSSANEAAAAAQALGAVVQRTGPYALVVVDAGSGTAAD